MNEQEHIEVLDRTATDVLGGLSSKGFTYLGTVLRDGGNLVGKYYEASFENRKTHRKIEIEYFPPTANRPDALALLVRAFVHDAFSVEAYLKNHNRTDELEKFRIASYHGTLEQRQRSVLENCRRFLEESIPEIVEGKRWETFPFDWQRYK